MKKTSVVLLILFCSSYSFGQSGKVIENIATLFSIEQASETIDFIIVDTLLNIKKPIFLWCQGSLPIPLFIEMDEEGYLILIMRK